MGSIILIAPPAAGKGTQSKLLAEKFHYNHVSTGDLLRDEISKKTPLGIKIDSIIKQGQLVSDEIVLSALESKIKNLDNYILDGFPRNLKQAKEYEDLLNKLNKKIDYVFYIDLPKETAKKRIVSRLSCSNCGKVYNTAFENMKPVKENICDICSNELTKRADDTEEVFENRYKIYLNETEPIINFYKQKGNLYKINGNLDKMEIFNQICSTIEDKK